MRPGQSTWSKLSTAQTELVVQTPCRCSRSAVASLPATVETCCACGVVARRDVPSASGVALPLAATHYTLKARSRRLVWAIQHGDLRAFRFELQQLLAQKSSFCQTHYRPWMRPGRVAVSIVTGFTTIRVSRCDSQRC